MTALLVYRNNTADALAWAADYKDRAQAIATDRWKWMAALYDAYGVPDDEDEKTRGAFVRGEVFSGIAWPEATPLPPGWFRPVKTPELIRPRSSGKAAKAALAEMRRFWTPDARAELEQRFGMPRHVFAGLGLYSPGARFEDDGVWVTWGTRDVEGLLGDVEARGWQRVPLAEFITRFGEDAL